jgi:quercetin dioxygenase-like cupin family protein
MSKLDPINDELFDSELFTAWVDALPCSAPPSDLRQKVLNRIRENSAVEPLRTVRADQGWVDFIPGISIKMLYRDEAGKAKSFLARLAPGVTLPEHDHDFAEECLVLEGEITQGDITIRAGDYHFASKGARHGPLTTRTGALVYLRTGLTQHIPEARV